MKRLTQEEAIGKFRETHGDKYDYSLVNYINNRTKIQIICPIHGIFTPKPNDHLNGNGCLKCARINRANALKTSIEDFLNKAKEIHGNKYDYSLVNYINDKTKISIICPVHGIFQQIANSHVQGHGCFKCGRIKSSDKHRINVVGQKYGRLMVISFSHQNKSAFWNCKCDCDNECKVSINSLKSGKQKSCGCLRKENAARRWTIMARERIGKKHPKWNHNLSDAERELSQNRSYNPLLHEWRKKVFERDNYTCQISGEKGERLCAHHIESWNSNKELRFVIDNGITLLKEIHLLFHKLYGKGNNTRIQFEEFNQRYNSG